MIGAAAGAHPRDSGKAHSAEGGGGCDNPPVSIVLPSRTSSWSSALDTAIAMPSSAIHSHVLRLRERDPQASPAEIADRLGTQYLRLVMGSGAAVGAAAATPGIGTGAAMGLTLGEIVSFQAASAAYTLALADVHHVDTDDLDRRRTLVLATMLGRDGSETIEQISGVRALFWARTLLSTLPTGTVRQVNKTLQSRMVRRTALRQSTTGLGRLAPFGVGAAVGLIGGRALGKHIVRNTGQAFGPPPEHFED